jgi:hypothetical protein
LLGDIQVLYGDGNDLSQNKMIKNTSFLYGQ